MIPEEVLEIVHLSEDLISIQLCEIFVIHAAVKNISNNLAGFVVETYFNLRMMTNLVAFIYHSMKDIYIRLETLIPIQEE